jgi:hypothetical protein
MPAAMRRAVSRSTVPPKNKVLAKLGKLQPMMDLSVSHGFAAAYETCLMTRIRAVFAPTVY